MIITRNVRRKLLLSQTVDKRRDRKINYNFSCIVSSKATLMSSCQDNLRITLAFSSPHKCKSNYGVPQNKTPKTSHLGLALLLAYVTNYAQAKITL